MEYKNQNEVPRKVKVKQESVQDQEFSQSRVYELNGLLYDGTFEAIPESSVKSVRIFNSRFVDEIEKVCERLRRKSRLLAQNYAY